MTLTIEVALEVHTILTNRSKVQTLHVDICSQFGIRSALTIIY